MKPGSDVGTRVMGMVLLMIGVGLGYWQIYLPIMQAARGESNVSYFTEAVLAAPLGALFGLFLTVFGAKGLEFLSRRPSRPVMILIIVATLLIGFGGIFGMQYVMRSFGYY